MSKIKLFSLLIPCLLIFASSIAVSATAICVPDDYSTIQEAINAATSGDTVVVRDRIYPENVIVNKDHLTIRSENGAGVTIIEAVRIDDSVFTIDTDYITIQGFTAKLGCSGIYLIDVNYCNIFDNITSSNTDNGIYCVRPSGNTLKGNTASDNSEKGIYVRDSSSNDLINNTASSNSDKGIYLRGSSNDRIWFNNFIANGSNIFPVDSTGTVLSSPEEIAYTYNSHTYTSHLGNYWDNYTGEDADNNGIGDTPHISVAGQDNYPLMESSENYIIPATEPKIQRADEGELHSSSPKF